MNYQIFVLSLTPHLKKAELGHLIIKYKSEYKCKNNSKLLQIARVIQQKWQKRSINNKFVMIVQACSLEDSGKLIKLST
jgi:hypothetical protein